MPIRPYSHSLGRLAHYKIGIYFLEQGWSISNIAGDDDYGEDMLVRIFYKGLSRPLYFFVQSKGCEDITPYLIRQKTAISYPMKLGHVDDWKDFPNPVVLIIWDKKTETAYWQIIQDVLESYQMNDQRQKINIHIPLKNVLDTEGMIHIAMRTLELFHRLEREREVLQVLTKSLKQDFNFEVEYSTELGFVDIKNHERNVMLFCNKMREVEYKRGIYEDELEEIATNIYLRSQLERDLKASVEINKRVFHKDAMESVRVLEIYREDVEGIPILENIRVKSSKEFASLEDLQVKE